MVAGFLLLRYHDSFAIRERGLLENVVILGAGPGGLAAGHYLGSSGIRPLVLEKLSYVAGLCHTQVRDGFRFDIGGHRWFTKNEELNRWFLKLMEGELVRVHRISRIYFDGKYYHYPIRISNVLRNTGIISSARALASYAAAGFRSFRDSLEPINMEDAYVRQFGRKLYEMFFQQYSEKVWGRACTEISADWVQQRTRGLSVLSALRDAMVGSRASVESLIDEFWYPRLGYSRICDRMAEDIMNTGGRVCLNSNVLSVMHDGSTVLGVKYRAPDGQEKYVQAEAVISSIPLTVLIRNLQPAPPPEILEAARGLLFRDLITVNIMLDRPRVTSDTWLYIHDRDIPFARLHEPKNWSADMAPPGKTSLVAEIFCTIGDEMWSRSDEALCELTVHHLAESLKFIRRDEVIGAFAFRAPQAYPVYGLDYGQHLKKIKNYIAGIRNLQIIGRGGTFRYNNSDHSIEMGLLAARNLLGGRHRIDAVNEEQEYLEEKRVQAR